MFGKILVPLDGSEYSECVLGHVKALATGCDVKDVIIMFVIEPINPGMYEVPAQVIEDALEKGKEYGTNYLAEVSARLKSDGLQVESVLINGRVAESILDYAKDNGVELITMSTHGRSGVSRWVMGSVADKVIRRSLVPVLLVTPSEVKASAVKS